MKEEGTGNQGRRKKGEGRREKEQLTMKGEVTGNKEDGRRTGQQLAVRSKGRREKGEGLRMLHDSQSNTKGGVYLFHFGRREGAGIIGQQSFSDADQFVTVNGAVVFQTLACAYLNLGGKTIAPGVNRSADDSGEAGINK
jgi:hypothetical protein